MCVDNGEPAWSWLAGGLWMQHVASHFFERGGSIGWGHTSYRVCFSSAKIYFLVVTCVCIK